MTDALRDAELLTNAVADVIDGADEARALGAYQAQRDRIAGPMFGVVDQLATYGWNLATVRRLLVELSSAMSAEVEALSALRV